MPVYLSGCLTPVSTILILNDLETGMSALPTDVCHQFLPPRVLTVDLAIYFQIPHSLLTLFAIISNVCSLEHLISYQSVNHAKFWYTMERYRSKHPLTASQIPVADGEEYHISPSENLHKVFGQMATIPFCCYRELSTMKLIQYLLLSDYWIR